jgi:Uma2 family endonuclease
MSAQPEPRLSAEEYLAIDRAATTRSEFYNGRMFAMSGGTHTHGRVIGNLSGELHAALKKTGCYVVPSDQRVRVGPNGLYTYPDIVGIFGKPEFADDQRDTLLNPALIIEVLSPSTEGYDRGFKASQYRTLPSLQEYAFVSQTEPRIEIFRRQPAGDWLLAEYAGMDAVCRFTSVNCDLGLADVYDGIIFEADPASTRPGKRLLQATCRFASVNGEVTMADV